METWLILFIVVAACSCLIGCCACCAVRRFTPENERGPQWEVNSKGERWVPARNQVPRQRDNRGGWMWNEGDQAAPDRLPVAPNRPGSPVRGVKS
jgi:hypothetical protein